MRVVVVGFGSIGRRHTENLENLGHTVFPVDVGEKLRFDCDCVFICSPTQHHCKHAYEYLSKGIPTFIEKPLTDNLSSLKKFLDSTSSISTLSMVGCNLRFHPAIRAAKELISKHKPVFARAEFGYYLPFWRKGDYTKSYSASESGGVILDAIHETDYLYWLLGKFRDVATVKAKVSELKVKREDIAETSIIFESGVSGSIHQDYLARNYHRTLTLHFYHKRVTFTLYPTNIMYKKQAEYFLSSVQSRFKPMNNIEEAGYVLGKILEAK